MNVTHSHVKNIRMAVTYEGYKEALKTPLNERPMYEVANRTLTYNQIFLRLLGVPLDEDAYYNELFDLANDPTIDISVIGEDYLDKSMNNEHFKSIQKVINIHRDQQLSINRFVAFLDGEGLLLRSERPAIQRKIREALMETLQLFSNKEEGGLKHNDLRRILTDLIKWSHNHLGESLTNADLTVKLPKFIWYGPYKKTHAYFIYYLLSLGCDVIYISPSGEDAFASFQLDWANTPVHHFQNKNEAEPFPTEKRRRKSTVAYRASKEIESILNQDGSGIFKPWQLREYLPASLTLKTTYDELFLLVKEKAMIRPNFDVADKVVKIPHVFAKIQGVSRDRKEYWERLHTLEENDHSYLIRSFPFSKGVSSDYRYHYRNALDQDGLVDPDKVMNAHFWTYKHLPNGLQQGIAYAIRKICEKSLLKKQANESEEDLKVYIFAQSMQLQGKMLQLIQRFDYSQDVPKLILFNNELNGLMSRHDAVLLLLMNQFGVDITVYNPAGHKDIENYIDERLYDVHWLEDVIFELEYKEPSFIKSALTKFFKKL
ncbi:YceG family protein [Cytobacillus sp. FSL M8-0252]|uniref:YceG family protein n=1 Tax=Cytobacillus sp. FSL M8-0252 TaxID=2921621 RepID=UPI0030F7B7E0